LQQYGKTLETIEEAIDREPDATRAMQAVVHRLKADLADYSWVGIYLLYGNELVLGPFEGKPSPHTHIPLGRGICGAAAAEKATIIVDDVNADPRYLACSLDTRSEIVVPIIADGNVLGEIDVDSDRPAAFGDADRQLLERVAACLAAKLRESSWPA
jgi:GAF domain-containing protein